MKKKTKKKYPRSRSASRHNSNIYKNYGEFIAAFRTSRNGGIAFRLINSRELLSYYDSIEKSQRADDFTVKNAEIRRITTSFDEIDVNNNVPTEILDESEKFFIDRYDAADAVSGDIVLLKQLAGHDCKVVKVLHRAYTEITGTAYEGIDELDEPVWAVEPDIKRLDFPIVITENPNSLPICEGDKVLVHITEYPEAEFPNALGRLVANYGDARSKKANYAAILEQNSVITKFSDEALEEAEERSKELVTLDGRVDLRGEKIFTLDGEDAKDLDDAISVRRHGDNFILGVHIADVSHYVTTGSALDREAMSRGTSIYFADRVIPMLPEALSNGICSLNSGVDRYVLSAFIEVDAEGEIINTELKKTVIRSVLRGSYGEFNQLLSGEADEEIISKYAVIPEETLQDALELYGTLKRKSDRRGALELESSEAKILIDENGEPIEIVKRTRGIGERMIEQFMLCANEGVANWLRTRSLPCVYRIHEQPDEEKIANFKNFAHGLGLTVPYQKKGSRVTAEYFSEILKEAITRGIEASVSSVLLRTMMKAKYSSVCSRHFGLGSGCYCHFTSPIRRYPDLSVHRIISAALENEDHTALNNKFAGFAALSARVSSDRELHALTVEREMDQLFKALYLSSHIGEEFDAAITGITAFGMFCTLPNTCEGLVNINTLDEHYEFNEASFCLVSRIHTYRLGESVKVKVSDVDISSRRIEFKLLNEPRQSFETAKSFSAEREYSSSKYGKSQRRGNSRKKRDRHR